uniref:Phorbol-ester/DAG-type domain-containing protein n=1 Tax=Mesocestoides corti TaxID=53468 RepID=A0A5K3F161_MESCO
MNFKGWLSMRNIKSFQSGFLKFIGQISELLFDQAMWDTCLLATPGQESWSILTMTCIWCAFPLMFGTSCGLGSLALGFSQFTTQNHAHPTVEVTKRLFGQAGLLLLFALYAFIVTTATVLQIFSITKVMTHGIYAVHMRPFRVSPDFNCCIFCGKSKGEITLPNDKCQCCEYSDCLQCQEDLKAAENGHRTYTLGCPAHGLYLNYTKGLSNARNTSVIIVICAIVPLGLLLNYVEVCQIVLNELPKSCVVGAFGSFVMALYWDNLTEPAVFIGSLMSSTLAVTTWFTLNLLHKYWADFPLNITEVGIVSDSFGILCSFMLPAAIVFATKINKPDSFTMEETQLTWKRTLQLGDPINPWMHTYAQTFRFPLSQSSQLTVAQVNAAMQPSRRVAAVGTALYFALFTLLLGLGCIPETLSLDGFRAWVIFIFFWLVCSLVAAILLPILSEVPLVQHLCSTVMEKTFLVPRIECSDTDADIASSYWQD